MSTPARRQYLTIKAQHPGALLAFQMGDFFEFFDEDAQTVARELQIVLTSRGHGAGEVSPLAGVPVHAIETYLARLVAKGYRVAVCEQVSQPGHGLVERAVTRILTPGTIIEPAMLPLARDNYLVAVAFGRSDAARNAPTSAGLAYVDASTGAFACVEWSGDVLPDALRAEVQRLAPAEVLVAEQPGSPSHFRGGGRGVRSDDASASPSPRRERGPRGEAQDDADRAWLGDAPRTGCPTSYFDDEAARARLCRHFGVTSLAAFGCEGLRCAVAAAGAIVAYLERMNPALLRLLPTLQTYETAGFVEVDGRTWRALEVVEPARTSVGSGKSGTVLATLDATRTAMGARLLRRTLLHPLRDRATLEERLDAVEELRERGAVRERVAAVLDGLGDVERLLARVVHGSAVPREMHALAAGLARVPLLTQALKGAHAGALVRARGALDDCAEVRALIGRALAEPGEKGDGRLLRQGYDADLDRLTSSLAKARRWIAALEVSERERTSIKSLKVGFNKVFGYYIEISRPNLPRVPDDYQRRQTLTTGERYVTAELKEHEALVLHAEEQIEALERALYTRLLEEVAAYQGRLRATAAALAGIDVSLALAEVALVRGFVRPELVEEPALEIEDGRHPLVEAMLDGTEFIPNDTCLDATTRVILLTGPNMAGKSTYLRQVALIALLAQAGSFVPARRARIGLVDRIFARVGAEDDLARGLSTFMIEMLETAYILRHATERSLIILDEVGRGTSTSDGVALARAVTEYLHDRVGARTLFATHYHELATLRDELPGVSVARMEVAERDGEAIFLHRVVPGASKSSYGIQVARMAGLPPSVTTRAGELLAASTSPSGHRHESGESGKSATSTASGNSHALAERPAAYPAAYPTAYPATLGSSEPPACEHAAQVPFLPPAEEGQRIPASIPASIPEREVALALASINVAATTPMEAINLLFSLQQRAMAALHARAAHASEPGGPGEPGGRAEGTR